MASASSSAQAAFGLGRRKKNPGLLDQIGMFFGGDKKRKSKGSFRALSPATQKASATSPRKRGAENAVVHFFRTIVSPAPPKSRGNQKSQSAKAKKASGDGKGTLTRIFKMGPQTELAAGVNTLTEGNDQQGQTPKGSRSASPAKR